MKRTLIHLLAVTLFSVFTLILAAPLARAQQPTLKEQLVGTWSLVLVDNILPDHSRVALYGPNPQGILTFDANGHYSLQILRSGRARFAANDKSKGTPEENQATVQGTNCHFGTYTVNDADGSITFHIEHASFPNWEGTEQKRPLVLKGDTLTYTVPNPTTGNGATGEVSWRRVR
jgi:hypothetical protein